MKHLRLAISLMLLPPPAGSPGESPPAPPPACAPQEIRRVDFGAHTFIRKTPPGEDGRPTIVRMRGGKYVTGGGAEVFLMRSAYGDLTGDGRAEAAVVLRGQNTAHSRTLDEVFVYGMDGREAVLLANFDGGRRGDYIFRVTIEGGLLGIDLAVVPDGPEGDGVPRQYRSVAYRVEGGGAVEVERSPLKEIPEHLKEIG